MFFWCKTEVSYHLSYLKCLVVLGGVNLLTFRVPKPAVAVSPHLLHLPNVRQCFNLLLFICWCKRLYLANRAREGLWYENE